MLNHSILAKLRQQATRAPLRQTSAYNGFLKNIRVAQLSYAKRWDF